MSVSRRWLSDYGLGERDLRGLSHYEVFPEITEAWKEVHRRALAGEVLRNDNDRFERADGSVQWLEWEVRPWHTAAGEVAGIVIMSEDVTERKQAQDALQKAYEELEQRVRVRTAQLIKTNEDLERQIAERKRTEAALRESEMRYRAITENARDGIITIDSAGTIMLVNAAAEAIFGYSRSEMEGKPLGMLMPERLKEKCLAGLKRYLETGIQKIAWSGVELPGLHRNGSEIPLEMSFGEFTRNGNRYFTGIVRDISKRKKMEDDLRSANARLNSVLNSITEAYYALDSGWRFIELNKEAERLLGPAPEILGKVYWEKFPQARGGEIERRYRLAAQRQVPEHFEAHSGITGRWYELHAYPRQDRLEVYFKDISDRKTMEEEIRHMAQHDPLTGFRTAACSSISLQWKSPRRAGIKRDLRSCSWISTVLRKSTIRWDMRPETDCSGSRAEIQGRYGNPIRSRESAEMNSTWSCPTSPGGKLQATSLLRSSSALEAVMIDAHEMHISTSVGISIFPDDSEEVDTLLRYADIAMYHAKESGRNTFRFYNPSINVRSIEKISSKPAPPTIARGELSVHYQPQIDIKTKRISYAEALVRWNHPERGLLDPGFPAACRGDRIIAKIDEWVLRSACSPGPSMERHRDGRILFYREPVEPRISEPGTSYRRSLRS